MAFSSLFCHVGEANQRDALIVNDTSIFVFASNLIIAVESHCDNR